MNHKILAVALAAFLACGPLRAGEQYDVDITAATTDLESVPDTDVTSIAPTPPWTGVFDATSVASGNEIWIFGSAAASYTVDAGGLSVAGGGGMHIGQQYNGTNSAAHLTINLDGDLVVGDASGRGVFTLGSATSTTAAMITGKKLNIVDGDVLLESDTGNTVMTFDSMTFDRGTLTMTGDNTLLRITGAAVIGHGTASNDTATLTTASGAQFYNGLTLARGGVLEAGGANSTVAFSGSTDSQRLTLAGGTVTAGAHDFLLEARTITVEAVEGAVSTLDAGTGSIAFRTGAAMTVKGDLDIINANTAIELGSYKQSAGVVEVTGTGGLEVAQKGEISGGSFQAVHSTFEGGLDVATNAHLKHGSLTLGTDSALRIGRTAFLDLAAGDLTVNGDADVEIFGTMIVGESGGQALKLVTTDSGATVTIQGTALIQLTEDFINKLDGTNYLGTVIVDVAAAGQITLPSGSDTLVYDDFLYGSYTYAIDAGEDLVLSSYSKGVKRDGTYDDFLDARDRLHDRYGPILSKGDGFVENIYKSSVREDAAAPEPPYDRLKPSDLAAAGYGPEADSYAMNMANFQAFARGDGDISLAGMYTGLNNAAVVDAAMSTAVAVTDHIKLRQRGIVKAKAVVRETVVGEAAMPSLIFEADKAQRVWFGGFGFIEEADARNGIPGYRYAPGGFVSGYDYTRENYSVGVAYAYAKGDFADKSALKHDSVITSHTVNLHGTYYDSSGLFASVMGGYTFSDNEMGELRMNPAAGSASWNRSSYHTNTLHGAAEFGYEMLAGDCLTVTPSVGFTYVHAASTNHMETLGSVAAGRVRGVSNHSAYIPARVELGYEVKTGAESRLVYSLNGGYAYNFTNDSVDGTFDPLGFANVFTHSLVGRDAGHHSFNAGAGVRFFTDQFDIGLNYDFNYKSNYTAHRLMATAGFSF